MGLVSRSPYGVRLYGAWVPDVLGPATGSPDSSDDTPRCSAKGCRAAATTELRWRNPKLHDASRVKVWLACDEHADHLASYLDVRGFLLERVPR